MAKGNTVKVTIHPKETQVFIKDLSRFHGSGPLFVLNINSGMSEVTFLIDSKETLDTLCNQIALAKIDLERMEP